MKKILIRIKRVLYHPGTIRNKLLWKMTSRKLKHIGDNCLVGIGFTIQGEQYISIGNNFSSGKKLCLETWDCFNGEKTGMIPNLEIGNDVTITENCHISCMNHIQIGDGVLFGPRVFITDNFHGKNTFDELPMKPMDRKLWSRGPIKIGNNVWIGANVCIMPNVTIGDNAVIGANSVITHDVPQNAIVAGVPARVLRVIEE